MSQHTSHIRSFFSLLATAMVAVLLLPGVSFAYNVLVANNMDNSVSIINGDVPNQPVELIENVGSRPYDIAQKPQSMFSSVTLANENRFQLINNQTDELAPGGSAAGGIPTAIAYSSDGSYLFVVNSGSNDVYIYKPGEDVDPVVVPVSKGPSAIAISNATKRAFVTNEGSNSVSVIDFDEDNAGTYGTVVKTIRFDRIDPQLGKARTPKDITRLVAFGLEFFITANSDSGNIALIANTRLGRPPIPPDGLAVGGLSRIPPAFADTGDVQPWAIAATPDNRKVVVADRISSRLVFLDVNLGLGVAGDAVQVGRTPNDIEIADDGIAYVANRGANSVSVVDTNQQRLVRNVGVGREPTGLAISPVDYEIPCGVDGVPTAFPMNPGDPEPKECESQPEPVPPPENPPPLPPGNPKQKVQVADNPPERCDRVLYENKLKVPREIRLRDLIKKKGVAVRVAADKPSSANVKIEITGKRARQYRIYGKKSRKKSKLLAKAKVKIGTGYKTVRLKARGKTRRAIKRALRLKKAPKSTKLKISLASYAVSNKRLKRLNAQTVRALRRGKPRKKGTYEKVRQVVDRTRCAEPLKAKISGPRDAKLKTLVTRKAKRGTGLKVEVSCSEDCKARVGIRLWGRYEIGLKFRKAGQKKGRWLSSRTVKLKAGETRTLKLKGISSKRLRRLLLRGAKKKRYDRVKVKYLIEARTSDGRSGAGAGTVRVRLGF